MAQIAETPPTFKNKLTLFFGVSLSIMLTIFAVRLVVDIAWRMPYPFILQFSAGLGLSVVGFSWLIFMRSMAGITGSFFGVLADKYGRRIMMAIGLVMLSVGLLGVAFSQQWWTIGPMIILGLGATSMVPIQQAYISDLVVYEKRGRALGSVDTAYALAGILGMPLVGWLIDIYGWRTPFLIFSGLALIAAPVIWFGLPGVEERTHSTEGNAGFWTTLQKSNVLATVVVAFSMFLAAACFITVWGVWLSEDFGLSAVTLGVVATVVSIAELGGIVTTSLFIDRIGKRRGGQLGFLLLMIGFVILPFSQGQLPFALVMLVLMGAAVEFTIVSLFPLYSEQAPEARGTLFALVGVGASVGLAVGSPITAILWERFGLGAVCSVAIAFLLIATFLLRRFLVERGAEPDAVLS